MLDLTAARLALRHILTTRLGNEVQVVISPDQITPPCLLIGMPSVDYQGGTQSTDMVEWPLYAIFPRVHDEAAVEQADRWISGTGPESIRTIVMEDQSWDGTIHGVFIRRAVAEVGGADTVIGELPQYRWDMEVTG